MNARAMVILGALVASIAACRGPDPAGEAAGRPALWEPIDKDFKGCEGG